jgi:hypothetical protein
MIISSPPKFFAGTVVLGGAPAEFNMQGYVSGSIINPSSNGLLTILLIKAGSGETQKIHLIAGTALNFMNIPLSQIIITVSEASLASSVNFQLLYYTKTPETDFEITSLEASSSMWLNTVGTSEYSGFQIFTSSQNWTVPPGVFKIKVLAIGGGGGGGGGYSSTYVGGGGASGGVAYAEMLVVPGTELSIAIGGGGSPGSGGASPTPGGAGGDTIINGPNGAALIAVYHGNGGGAATSSANGSAGEPGGSTQYLMQGVQGPTSAFVTKGYGLPGNSGNGQVGGVTPVFAPDLSTAASGIQYGVELLGSISNEAFGNGSPGGGVNSDGEPGIQGAVVIWWGDD